MAENSAISWTDDTFNPWIGCTKVSPACDGCYAEALMGEGGRFARAKWGAPGKGAGTRVRTGKSTWAKPRKWNREQAALERNCHLVGEVAPPRFVFCASLADVFDNAVPAEWRRDLFDLIRATPHLTWLLLTKRPGNIVKLFSDTLEPETVAAAKEGVGAPLETFWPPNAAMGTTIEDWVRLRLNAPALARAAAVLRPAFIFWSCEPLREDLGDLSRIDTMAFPGAEVFNALTGEISGMFGEPVGRVPRVDWIITGGETDQGAHKARPADPEWFRSLRYQCAVAGIPFHFKQWGEWQPFAGQVPTNANLQPHRFTRHGVPVWRIGKDRDPGTLDGVRHDARPRVVSHV